MFLHCHLATGKQLGYGVIVEQAFICMLFGTLKEGDIIYVLSNLSILTGQFNDYFG